MSKNDLKISPEPPSLWMVDENYSDKVMVERAENHLATLLSSPYYREAYLRLLRQKHPSVSNRSGNLPHNKGDLAAKFQWPESKKKQGRPKLYIEIFEHVLAYASSHPEETLISICRRIINVVSTYTKHDKEKNAQKLSQKLRNYRKKLSK